MAKREESKRFITCSPYLYKDLETKVCEPVAYPNRLSGRQVNNMQQQRAHSAPSVIYIKPQAIGEWGAATERRTSTKVTWITIPENRQRANIGKHT